MTPDELGQTLHAIGWTGREFARRMGCSYNMAHDMVHGRTPVPALLVPWLTQIRA